MTAMPWPRAILHCDMDAFFVNVHRLRHPEHVGVPLAVGGVGGRGVVASASYEARRFGVRSAMPTARAMRLCPRLVVVGADWARIRESSGRLIAALREFGPVEVMSVDEAYVDVTERLNAWLSAAGLDAATVSAIADDGARRAACDPSDDAGQVLAFAERIRAAVVTATTLPASVGLSTSKGVAKVASDFEKPEGVTVVPPGSEAAFLTPLSVRAIYGVGPRTAERLSGLGIKLCAELAETDPAMLTEHFGSHGAAMGRRARGEDDRPVRPDRGPAKQISSERTFATDIVQRDELLNKVEALATQVAGQLQARDGVAHTVVVKFRWSDFTTFTRQRTVAVPVSEAGEISAIARKLWQRYWTEGQPVRLVGVGVTNIECLEGSGAGAPAPAQLRLEL